MDNIARTGLSRLCSRVVEMSRATGTPFYAYDWPTLQGNIDVVLSALSECGLSGRGSLCLAFFALPNMSLLEMAMALDAAVGVDCNATEEISALQERSWQEWDRVVFSGGVLPREELLHIARCGCLIHAASKGNLEILVNDSTADRLGLRLDLSDAALKGVRVSDLDECFNLARRKGNEIVALHAYPGTRVRNLGLLAKHAELLMSIASQYPAIQDIDLGGGFDYDYESSTGDISLMVDFRRYFSAVRTLHDQLYGEKRINLRWEPGRIVFAGIGFFVTRVLEVKRRSLKDVDIYVDSSFVNMPTPKLLRRQHLVVLLDSDGERKQGIDCEARICGATTLSTDQLLPFPCAFPEVEPGDYVVVLDVGAYGYAGSYNFLGKARPAEILLTENDWTVIRNRQRNTHLLEGLQDVSPCSAEDSTDLPRR